MKALGRWLTEHGMTVGSPIALLLAWEWASAAGLLRAVFFPRPSTILAHLRDLALDGTLWGHTATTLARIGWSFTLAAVLGVAIGLAMVVTSAVTSFFLIAFTTTHGVRQIDRLVVEAAVHYGARGWRLFATVLLPGALPFIFTGLRLGLGFSLIVVVAVEIVSASRGLGALLWLSWQILKVEDMYATFFVIALLGALLSYGLAALRARLLPWVPDVGDPR